MGGGGIVCHLRGAGLDKVVVVSGANVRAIAHLWQPPCGSYYITQRIMVSTQHARNYTF